MNIDGIDIPLAVEHAGPKAIEAYVAAIKAQCSTDEALIAAGVRSPEPVASDAPSDTTSDTTSEAAPAEATTAETVSKSTRKR